MKLCMQQFNRPCPGALLSKQQLIFAADNFQQQVFFKIIFGHKIMQVFMGIKFAELLNCFVY